MLNLKQLYAQFKPKHWYSWQTAIWLSAISGILSSVARLLGTKPFSLVAVLIATLGWFFLIAGISWAVKEQGSRFAPWITASVFCVFVFGSYPMVNWSQVVMVWPVISAIIFALPYFWDESLKEKLPNINDRITILLILGSQLILSFWIQFFLVLSTFIQEYPSFYSDDLSNSLFIVRTPATRTQDPRGVYILDLLDLELVSYYEKRPWVQVDQELRTDPSATISRLFKIVLLRTPSLKEDPYWHLEDPVVSPEGKQYKLLLEYEWRGAKARIRDAYFVAKTCTFLPMPNLADPQGELLTAIACQPSEVHGWLKDKLD